MDFTKFIIMMMMKIYEKICEITESHRISSKDKYKHSRRWTYRNKANNIMNSAHKITRGKNNEQQIKLTFKYYSALFQAY